jgi:predicted RNA-binding Zn-ribbon protein involved in translation (DUF1610 family)
VAESGHAGAPNSSTACPRCGSDRISRSQRRGIHEAVVLKKDGLSPYRCQDCGERFIRPSRHKGHSRHHHSLAGRLGIRDLKARRRFLRIIIAAVMTVLAIITALLLFGYFTRPAPPPPDVGSMAYPRAAEC